MNRDDIKDYSSITFDVMGDMNETPVKDSAGDKKKG